MQLEIDGAAYEFPSVGSFDLDEDRIFFQATGMHAEDVWIGLQDDGDLSFSALIGNEGFLPAMAHIAYRREHPDEAADVVLKIVGRQKRMNMIGSLAASIEEEPAGDEPGKDEGTTSVPNESLTSSSSEKSRTPHSKDESSGRTSETSSVPQDDDRGITGTGASGTSSMSDRLRQVV